VSVWRKADNLVNGNAGSMLNLDLQGINTNPGGALRLTASFTKFSGTGGKSGTGLSLQHNQSGVFGADNTLWAQWSQGSAGTDMGFGNAKDDSNTKAWRIADSLAWLNGPLTGQTLINFGKNEVPNGAGGTRSFKNFAISGRAAYAFTKNFKLQGELGTSNGKPDGGKSMTITKFTIAPTLSIGPNYYDRPELRFYVSTFSMNDAYALANGQSKKTKSAAGFQAEIWF
jgi:maltoporin